MYCRGPWRQVQKFKADSIGPEDMAEPAESQDFRGFRETSQVRMPAWGCGYVSSGRLEGCGYVHSLHAVLETGDC